MILKLHDRLEIAAILFDKLEAKLTKRLEILENDRELRRNIADQVELFLMGKAVAQLEDNYPKFPANIFFHTACRPSFFYFWHNHFDNYGNFISGNQEG